MVTPKMAQISLRFGADDIDGTVVEEKIYHDAGATTEQGNATCRAGTADPRGGPGCRSSGTRCITRSRRSEDSFTIAV